MQLIRSADEMILFGQQFSKQLKSGDIVFLHGELGAGKTTLVRGILKGFGYDGIVKSPTYALVESYFFETITIHHFDFYRLHDVSELEMMGFSDYLSKDAILLIEWPERFAAALPKPAFVWNIHTVEGTRAVASGIA